MASTLSDLKKKAAQLPEHERAELALSLIESLDIERRVRQLEKGDAKLIPAEDVFARIRRRLG